MKVGLGGLGLWVRSEWRHTWRSLAGLSLIVALGGALTIAAVAGARRVDSAFDRFTGQTNTSVMISTYDALADSAGESSLFTLAEPVADIDGVEGVMPMSWIAAGLDAPGLREVMFAAMLGDGIGERPPDPLVIVDGRSAEPSADDEVMINVEAARVSGLSVGDTVTTLTLTPAQYDAFVTSGQAEVIDGPAIDVEVVGVYRTVEDITDLPEAFTMYPPGFLAARADQIAHCDCSLFVNADPAVIPAITQAIDEVPLNAAVVVDDANAEALSRISQAVAIESNALWIAAAIAGIAALLIAGQAIDRHLSERRRAWESLSAIGVTRSQLVTGWFLALLPVVIVGVAASGLLAIVVSPLFPRGIARTAEPDPGVRVDPATIATGLLVLFVVLSALVGLIAVVRTSRRSVGPARRPFIVSWLGNAPAPIALGAGFAIDPARDRRGVSAFGAVIGLGLAISGVVAVALVDSSIDELLSSPRAYAADWDMEMSNRPDDVEEAIRQTLAEPLVEALALEWQAGGVAYATHHGNEGTTQYATALENIHGSVGPMLDVGRPATGSNEVTLGRATADTLDVDVGEEITFTSRSGVDEPFVLTGIGWMADDEDSDSFALMTTDGLARLQADPEINNAYVRLAATDPVAIERLHDVGWTDVQAPAKSGNLGQIGDVPAMLALALCVLGLAGVVNALLVALRRRRDDLAITRAIGFTTSQTASTMRWQGVTTATLAILVGVPCGVIIGRSIWRLLADGAGVTDLVTIPWTAIVVVAIAAVGVVTAIAALVGRRAARLRPAAILRSE